MITVTSIDKNELFRYLGYGKSTPDDAVKKLTAEIEKELLAAIFPRYIYRIFHDISICTECGKEDESVIFGNTNFKLIGKDIARHLKGCNKVILMAATLSAEADRLIRRMQALDITKAAIANSAANAAIEQVCDAVCDEIAARLPNLYQTSRFSPGYGDLPLAIQKEFLTLLDAPRKIGLTVTESNIMVPEKSVSAVIGLSDNPIQKKRRGCQSCNLRHSCAFRLQGEHCAS